MCKDLNSDRHKDNIISKVIKLRFISFSKDELMPISINLFPEFPGEWNLLRKEDEGAGL